MEKNNRGLVEFDKDSQINVVLSGAGSSLYKEIDLVNIFHDMKLRKRLFAWMLILCILIGVSAPLLMYQINPPILSVSSAITLDYDAIYLDEESTEEELLPVSDLTAPDGLPLDLNQITSAYVLQNALQVTPLSYDISVSQLRGKIIIQRNLTEESKRLQEIAARMISDKEGGAFQTLQSLELTYENRAIVTLTNGFGSEDDTNGILLPDNELKALLDNILSAYNNYMVMNYADQKLPDDEFTVIDTERMDILESLDSIRSAVSNLYEYCYNQPENIKETRSSVTGLSLNDILDTLELIKSVNVDYLYSYVYTNSLARDTQSMLTSYEFQLRTAEGQLASLEEQIKTVQEIIDTYKNDEIYVSMQDSDTSRTTQTTTDYYNNLILQQSENFDQLAEVNVLISDLNNKIVNLQNNQSSMVVNDVADELDETLALCKMVYKLITDHMTKIFGGYDYNSYVLHTAAYGKVPGFLASCMGNMVLGAIAGVAIACILWFLSGLVTEMKKTRGFMDEMEGKTDD